MHLKIYLVVVTLIVTLNEIKGDIQLKAGVPHVKLPHGTLSGVVQQSRNRRSFYAFKGLRYANPPKRFEAAEIFNQSWQNVLRADKYGARCMQPNFINPADFAGEEDCLFLNIYIPTVRKPVDGKTLPVMVWIHGGAFEYGDGDSYGPEYFMDQDVILITLNYRLGPLGFLSTEDDIVPGNNGLKDQVVALKWIKQNINSFGGNANRVTVFGNSAGSASVSYLLLSPMAKDLFQNAICISGSASDPWAMKLKPLAATKKLGSLVNCPTSNSVEMVECLRKIDANEIVLGAQKLVKWSTAPIAKFGPTVEKRQSANTFLHDTPLNIIASGNYNKVPLIMGVTENEGILINAAPVLINEKLTKELNEQWDSIAPITFEHEDAFSKKDLPVISRKIRSFYFGDKLVSEETRENLTNLYSDIYFVRGTQKMALLHALDVPVYLYLYTYNAKFSLTTYFGIKGNHGVGHADDLHIYFPTEIFGPKIPKSDFRYEFSEKMVKLWSSFAIDGKPTFSWGVKWEPLGRRQLNGGKRLEWYKIDEETTYVTDPFKERMSFWDDLFSEYSYATHHRDEL